jgi:hypothetical protein
MTVRRFARIYVVVTALVCVAGGAAYAQTDYSPRIRSLGTGFAGIVDDPFTDAFLNPARVGDMPGRGAWFGRLPGRSIRFLYPTQSPIYFMGTSLMPPAGPPRNNGWSYEPYSLGLFTPVSSNLKLSLTGELYVRGSNYLDENTNVGLRYPPSIDVLSGDMEVRGGDGGTYHGVFDAALGSGSPESDGLRWGARATVNYDRSRNQSVRTSSRVRADTGGEDVSLYYNYSSSNSDTERLAVVLSFGIFREKGFLAQAVAGVDAGRETLVNDRYEMTEDDEDYDGDGTGPGDGNSPLYRLDQVGVDSHREYDTGRVFGRLGLRWGRRVSSWHQLAVTRSSGDGQVGFENRELVVEVGSERFEQEASYMLDGESRGYRFSNAVGFVDQALDNVMFAVAIEAIIWRTEFEEGGDGRGAIQLADNGLTSRFEAPYTQLATYDRDIWQLSIPAAFEWDINEYAAWRFGVDFRASRTDINSGITQDTETLGFPDQGFLPVVGTEDDLGYSTYTYFTSGVTLSFRDRLKLELLTGPDYGGLYVFYFSSAILEFRF